MQNDAELLAKIIRARKTEKILSELDQTTAITDASHQDKQQHILDALATAGWAPFHYPRNIDDIAEPWRAHIVWQPQAQKAAQHMVEQLGITTKEPKLTAACDALVLITWLPEFDHPEPCSFSQIQSEKIIARNHEHIAAGSAMVQNFLLMLTAHNMANYWSSGGCLGGDAMFEYFKITPQERLLAAVFIEFAGDADSNTAKERKAGAHRDRRGTDWIKLVA